MDNVHRRLSILATADAFPGDGTAVFVLADDVGSARTEVHSRAGLRNPEHRPVRRLRPISTSAALQAPRHCTCLLDDAPEHLVDLAKAVIKAEDIVATPGHTSLSDMRFARTVLSRRKLLDSAGGNALVAATCAAIGACEDTRIAERDFGLAQRAAAASAARHWRSNRRAKHIENSRGPLGTATVLSWLIRDLEAAWEGLAVDTITTDAETASAWLAPQQWFYAPLMAASAAGEYATEWHARPGDPRILFRVPVIVAIHARLYFADAFAAHTDGLDASRLYEAFDMTRRIDPFATGPLLAALDSA